MTLPLPPTPRRDLRWNCGHACARQLRHLRSTTPLHLSTRAARRLAPGTPQAASRCNICLRPTRSSALPPPRRPAPARCATTYVYLAPAKAGLSGCLPTLSGFINQSVHFPEMWPAILAAFSGFFPRFFRIFPCQNGRFDAPTRPSAAVAIILPYAPSCPPNASPGPPTHIHLCAATEACARLASRRHGAHLIACLPPGSQRDGPHRKKSVRNATCARGLQRDLLRARASAWHAELLLM